MDAALKNILGGATRKAIQLQVTLWIEGEDQPAHNFAKSTTQAIRDVISFGNWRHPSLKVNIKNIVEDTNYDRDEKSAG